MSVSCGLPISHPEPGARHNERHTRHHLPRTPRGIAALDRLNVEVIHTGGESRGRFGRSTGGWCDEWIRGLGGPRMKKPPGETRAAEGMDQLLTEDEWSGTGGSVAVEETEQVFDIGVTVVIDVVRTDAQRGVE